MTREEKGALAERRRWLAVVVQDRRNSPAWQENVAALKRKDRFGPWLCMLNGQWHSSRKKAEAAAMELLEGREHGQAG